MKEAPLPNGEKERGATNGDTNHRGHKKTYQLSPDISSLSRSNTGIIILPLMAMNK